MVNYLPILGLTGLCLFGIKESNNEIEGYIFKLILIGMGAYFIGYVIGKFSVHI